MQPAGGGGGGSGGDGGGGGEWWTLFKDEEFTVRAAPVAARPGCHRVPPDHRFTAP